MLEEAANGRPLRFGSDQSLFLTYLFGEVLGENAYPRTAVQRVLGRGPRDFAEYAREAAATGVWIPSPVAA